MAKKLAYERYLYLHDRLKGKKYPKIGDLADKFEISRRQAAREIEFMRLFLGAPIEYSAEHGGYFYADDNFQLPGLWVSEEEIVSLVVARRLAAALPDRGLKKKFDLFLRKVSGDMDLDLLRLEEKVSLKNVRYSRVEPAVFSAVLLALVRERQLAITYAPGHSQTVTQQKAPQSPNGDGGHSARQGDAGHTARTIDPLHLLVYMGNWHLIAWCHERRAVRDFLLSRVREATLLAAPLAGPVTSEEIKEQIEERYGIFFAGPATRVVLRFTPAGGRLVRDQVWFPGQECAWRADGSLLLSFPVADFRELVRDILPFGGDVEVLEPAELRRLLAKPIAEMAGMYGKK
jgi:predicted DNA-binding transcriptional regulator YafY